MNQRPGLVDQTKENIREAFWTIYKQKRIEKISITEISKTAGYNRTTFYKYFSDIYDVLYSIENILLEDFRKQILTSLESHHSESDFILLISLLYEKHGDYLKVLLSKYENSLFISKIKKNMRPLLIKQFALDEKVPYTEYIIEFGVSAIIGTLTHWLEKGMVFPADELAAIMRAMLRSAIQFE